MIESYKDNSQNKELKDSLSNFETDILKGETHD